MKMNSFYKVVLSGLFLMLLPGCASVVLAGSDTPPRYTLQPVGYDNPAEAPIPVRLIIADPSTEAALFTSKIAHSPSPLRYDYLTEGEWTDRMPRLFGIFLERSFENHGRIAAVGDRVAMPMGDYILHTDIRSFHVQTRGRDRSAEIAYFVRLTDRRNKTIGSQLFLSSSSLETKSVSKAVAAMNVAMERVGRETVEWAVAYIEEREITKAEAQEK